MDEAVGAPSELYEFDRGCDGGASSLALVGRNNRAKLISRACNTTIGADKYTPAGYGDSAFNAVSADGGEVFFTVCLQTSGQRFGYELPHQLFVRLSGSRTLEVSRPLEAGQPFGGCVGEGAGKVAGEVPCEGALARASADFAGASQDGSNVYFTTSAPLTGEDKDSGNDLYLANVGCPSGKPGCGAAEREVTSLRQVSHDPSVGGAAAVQGVVRVAPDGSRVYFVAGGDLLTGAARGVLEGEGRPVPQIGAANLYVYDANTGTTGFVGGLCSGAGMSGAVEDARCPSPTGTDSTLWTYLPEAEAQTAGGDGRFLVFATYAQLLASDSNVARDVYRYDAATGRLDRVSGGENGFDDNGNRTILNEQGVALGATIRPGHLGGPNKEQFEMDNRAISEDGSRIVFISAEPLSPSASNGLANVYEWHETRGGGEGSVSLISGGSGPAPVEDVVISTSGNDVFFVTAQGLVPQDTNEEPDVYDARLNGGFPPVPAPPQPCDGDACQGPLTNPAPLLVPGSAAQAPGENILAPASNTASNASTTLHASTKSARCRKGYVKRKGRCVKPKLKRQGKRASRRGIK
ncbi:MAG TPA: hypothetical protein VNY27_02935 [Solirubrobacteraceae bacterium]|nr:hypothetical protein [Solirubrobacteraceae bacterium]